MPAWIGSSALAKPARASRRPTSPLRRWRSTRRSRGSDGAEPRSVQVIHNRRTFLMQLGALAGAAVSRSLLAQETRQPTSPFRWREIDARTWIVERGGGNTTVLLEPGGVVVIDAKVGGM